MSSWRRAFLIFWVQFLSLFYDRYSAKVKKHDKNNTTQSSLMFKSSRISNTKIQIHKRANWIGCFTTYSSPSSLAITQFIYISTTMHYHYNFAMFRHKKECKTAYLHKFQLSNNCPNVLDTLLFSNRCPVYEF